MRKTSLIIGIAIISLSFYYALTDVSLKELQDAFMSLNYIYLIPAVFLIILSFLFRALRWRYLIRSVKEIKTTNLFSPLMVGFMGNMLPARAGEFIRAYLLGKRENISFSASFATIIVERLFDLAVVLLLLFYVIFFNSDVFSQGNTYENHKLMSYMFTFGQISFAGCLLIFIFSIFMQYQNKSAMKIVNICVRPLPKKWGNKIASMAVSF
ncbi:MAG: flippase-like domain-containing protein, partial [Thermodesulfovibrionia bacterium]|nr:flippase-like domain-containing protein [Thermodesulfovibrionia bacterium]